MADGFSGVKETYLDQYAEVFAGAGLGTLVFDNRGFGASDGEPRQEIDPRAQANLRHSDLGQKSAEPSAVWSPGV